MLARMSKDSRRFAGNLGWEKPFVLKLGEVQEELFQGRELKC
jgi:hypothetical protein